MLNVARISSALAALAWIASCGDGRQLPARGPARDCHFRDSCAPARPITEQDCWKLLLPPADPRQEDDICPGRWDRPHPELPARELPKEIANFVALTCEEELEDPCERLRVRGLESLGPLQAAFPGSFTAPRRLQWLLVFEDLQGVLLEERSGRFTPTRLFGGLDMFQESCVPVDADGATRVACVIDHRQEVSSSLVERRSLDVFDLQTLQRHRLVSVVSNLLQSCGALHRGGFLAAIHDATVEVLDTDADGRGDLLLHADIVSGPAPEAYHQHCSSALNWPLKQGPRTGAEAALMCELPQTHAHLHFLQRAPTFEPDAATAETLTALFAESGWTRRLEERRISHGDLAKRPPP